MSQLNRRRLCAWQPLLASLGLFALLSAAAPADEAPTVKVALAVQREVTDYETFTGRLEAAQFVELRPRINSVLEKIHFKPGMMVKKGDLLFELDPRREQTALRKAEAELTLAEARAKSSEKELARLRRLAATGAASKEELDQAEARHAETKASIYLARAVVEAARLNLAFTRVYAPVDGRLGLPVVTEGNAVVGDGADPTLLATIAGRDPMYGYFALDERTFLRLKRLELDGKIGKGPVPLWLRLADETGFPHKGTLDGVNNRLNRNNGALLVRGVFANPKGLLVPGLSANVRMPVSKPYTALLVTDSAIWTGQGDSVYVVNDKNVVESRKVKLGPLQEDGLFVIRTGLRPTDRVVVQLQQGVRPGAKVAPKLQPMPVRPAPAKR